MKLKSNAACPAAGAATAKRPRAPQREPRPSARVCVCVCVCGGRQGRGLGNSHGVGDMKGYVTRAPLRKLTGARGCTLIRGYSHELLLESPGMPGAFFCSLCIGEHRTRRQAMRWSVGHDRPPRTASACPSRMAEKASLAPRTRACWARFLSMPWDASVGFSLTRTPLDVSIPCAIGTAATPPRSPAS